MSRALAVIVIFVAAFIVLMGILGLFAGIAEAFPTTEEAFFKQGPEIHGAVLAIVGGVVVAVGLVIARLATRASERGPTHLTP